MVLLATALIALIGLPALSARLAKPGSTHPSFPLDAFAKPAFELVFDDANPISNKTALDLLQAHGQYIEEQTSVQSDVSVSEYTGSGTERGQGAARGLLQVYLHRSSPSSLHLCSITQPKSDSISTNQMSDADLRDRRRRIVENALKLLAPLKNTCLYHTIDWFTYSLCYGDAVKQFHALPGTNIGLVPPTVDPGEDSYVLGRWNSGIEGVKDGDISSDQANRVEEIEGKTSGTELMELVHFSSIEGSGSSSTELREGIGRDAATSVAGSGRYISQTWTDGTRCIINNEMRSTEVQFHCSNTPPIDRIALIKEVTTCSYVIVVHTPRLCAEPALAQAKEEVSKIHCQPILSDAELEARRAAAEKVGSIPAPSQAAPAIEGALPVPDVKMATEGLKASDGDLRSTMKDLVDRISQAASGLNVEQVNLVVARDANGHLIIQSQGETPQELIEMLTEQASNPEAEAGIQGGASSQERLTALLEKLLQQDGQVIDLSSSHNSGSEGTSQESGEGAQKPVKQQQGLKVGSKETAAARNTQMVKEKENFPQKVERYFQAQEAKEKQKRNDAVDQKGDGKDRGEGAPAVTDARGVHNEL